MHKPDPAKRWKVKDEAMPPAETPPADAEAAAAPAATPAPAVPAAPEGVAAEDLDVFGANVNDVGNGEPSGKPRDGFVIVRDVCSV